MAGGGLLPPEVASQFMTEFQVQTEFAQLMGWRSVGTPSGKLPKLDVGSRTMRAAYEDTDPTETTAPIFSEVVYNCTDVRVDYEITEKSIRENVEKEGLVQTVFSGTSKAFARQIVDLAWNGNTATLVTDPDYAFLHINDGWLKLLPLGGAAELDGSDYNGGDISDDHFFVALELLPDKWAARLDEFRFIMSPKLRGRLARYLKNREGNLGDAATVTGAVPQVAGVKIVLDQNLPVTTFVLAIPAHLAVAVNREMTLRSTNTSDKAIKRDLRIFAMYAGFDPVCLWADAAVVCGGLNVAPASDPA
jgi:HK97 family phage major capsid protein